MVREATATEAQGEPWVVTYASRRHGRTGKPAHALRPCRARTAANQIIRRQARVGATSTRSTECGF